MRVLLATNEPWGTYHSRPLLAAAAQAGVSLAHLVPDASEAYDAHGLLVGDYSQIEQADAVVLNGLLSDHVREIAVRAQHAGVPLIFSELAYLNDTPAPLAVRWAAVLAGSPASADTVAANAGVSLRDVQVVGWPLLDDLPARQDCGSILGLTTVSVGSRSGGGESSANQALARALDSLARSGHDVLVRPHPREPRSGWSRFALDASETAGHAIAKASLVVGAVGTSTLYCVALGVPMRAIATDAPHYLLDAGDLLSDTIEVWHDEALDALRAHVCGPIGDSAQRMVRAWISAAGMSERRPSLLAA